MLIQFILIALFIFALTKVILKFRSNELKGFETIAWVVFWLGAIFVIISPNSTFALASFLGVGRGVDAITYLAVALLFFLIFRIFVRLEKMERNFTALVREDALKNKK